jgi:hypothetical protein
MNESELKEFLDYKEKYERGYARYFDYFNPLGSYFGFYGAPTVVNYLKWALFCRNIVTDLSHEKTCKPVLFHCFIDDKTIAMPFQEVHDLIDTITKQAIAKNAWQYGEFQFGHWEKSLRPDCGDDMVWDFVNDIANRLS